MYKWNVLGSYNPEKEIPVSILENRGVKDIKDFLKVPSFNRSFESFPKEFKDSLKKGGEMIKKAMKANTPIIIFGDYDSDGINAAAILYNFFKDEKKYDKVSYFIPNRFEHSYGLSKGAIDESLKDHGGENVLFITVDVGITAYDEVSYIKKLGHSVVLTDHHQKPETLPKADRIIWSDKVCGSAISWILSKALGSKNKSSIANAAVATVTDLLPVMGFNRVIVKKGLEVMNTEPPPAFRKMLEVSGMPDTEVTTYTLGWVIGPRLNASGRMESSEVSVRLLTEKDERVLEELAKKLDSKNVERQEKTLEMYEMASDIDEEKLPKIIFSIDKSYHEGVIGLVSAKLTQKYFRPSVVISLDDGYGKGSVRSIPGINIIEVLRNFDDLFVDLGGHPMAGGFTIDEKNIPEMVKKVGSFIGKNYEDEVFVPVLDIDLEIPAGIIDVDILNKIDELRPFGMGNSQPVFLTKELGIVSSDIIGKDKTHLKLKLYGEGKYLKAVFFGGAGFKKDLKTGEKIDVVYTLNKNEYNGNTYVDLIVKDFRKA